MRSRGLIVSFIGMLAVLGILVAIAVIIVTGQLKKPAVGSTSTPAAVTCQQVLPFRDSGLWWAERLTGLLRKPSVDRELWQSGGKRDTATVF